MTKNELEDWLAIELEERDFTDILEDFDLDPYTVLWNLFSQGLVDEEIIKAV